MKNKILFIPLLLLASLGFSQNGNTFKRDTTRIKMGKSTILIFNDSLNQGEYNHDFGKCDPACEQEKEDWATLIVDIGLNGYTTPDNKLSLPPAQFLMEIDYSRSRSFGLTVSLKGADLIKDRLYLAPGLGLSWNSYFFENNIRVSTSNDSTAFISDSIFEFSKYKLRATYLEVPLVLGVRIGSLKTPLGLQVGVIGGFKINSIIKQKYTTDGVDYKVKVKDDFNINPFKLDAVARITISNIGLFARYSLTTLFEKNKAPELYPFSAGITIGGFKNKRKSK